MYNCRYEVLNGIMKRSSNTHTPPHPSQLVAHHKTPVLVFQHVENVLTLLKHGQLQN